VRGREQGTDEPRRNEDDEGNEERGTRDEKEPQRHKGHEVRWMKKIEAGVSGPVIHRSSDPRPSFFSLRSLRILRFFVIQIILLDAT
jgi:hypothetical protein